MDGWGRSGVSELLLIFCAYSDSQETPGKEVFLEGI